MSRRTFAFYGAIFLHMALAFMGIKSDIFMATALIIFAMPDERKVEK